MTHPRIRTAYHQHRAESGRLTSGVDTSDPDKPRSKDRAVQIQNWPRSLRDCVQADEGMTLIGADWAGIEWALVMWYIEQELRTGYHLTMLDRFQLDPTHPDFFDPHRFLASKRYGKPERLIDKDRERKPAKTWTFALLYGAFHGTIADKQHISRREGMLMAQAHEEAFRVKPWLEIVLERVRREHYIETAGGWRRYFWAPVPKATEPPNSIIQGTAADMMKYALVMAVKTKPPWVELLTTTHDFLMVQAPEERAEEGAGWLRGVMETPPPFPALEGRKWRAEVSVGKTWRDVS